MKRTVGPSDFLSVNPQRLMTIVFWGKVWKFSSSKGKNRQTIPEKTK
jgi:hypothetical protein